MKILNIIALSTLTILPIVGCSEKENKSVEQKNKNNENKNLWFWNQKSRKNKIFNGKARPRPFKGWDNNRR